VYVQSWLLIVGAGSAAVYSTSSDSTLEKISPRKEALGRPKVWSPERLASFFAFWIDVPIYFEYFLRAKRAELVATSEAI